VAALESIDRPNAASDGTLLLVAESTKIQYEPRDRRDHRELFGINPTDGILTIDNSGGLAE